MLLLLHSLCVILSMYCLLGAFPIIVGKVTVCVVVRYVAFWSVLLIISELN